MSLWNEPKRSRHHYVDAIIKQSKSNRVFWINRPYYHEESLSFKGVEVITDQLIVIHIGQTILPGFLPKTFEEVFNLNLNNKLKVILFYLNSRKIVNFITICFDYKALGVLKKLPGDYPKYYFCNDFFGFWPKLLYQKKISTYVDGVIATDPRLVNYFEKYNKNVLFLPHGLWYSNDVVYQKNTELRKLVYSGTLNFSIDYYFLNSIIDQLDVELHLIGPIVEIDKKSKLLLNSLLKNQKVIYHGHVDDLTLRNRLIQVCDICLLPYKTTFNGFVLKFYDYLHVGKPIFSTCFNSFWLSESKKFVTFFDSSKELREQLEIVHSKYCKSEYELMRISASQSTWDIRLLMLMKFININM